MLACLHCEPVLEAICEKDKLLNCAPLLEAEGEKDKLLSLKQEEALGA